MNNIKLAIVDIDGMFYHSLRDSMVESISTFKSKFENLLKETGATHYVGFYSMDKYFRHRIDPNYKGNRVGRPLAKYYKALKEWAIAEYGFQSQRNVEADDLCAYWMNSINNTNDKGFVINEYILCSPDKDLLKSIEGRHFNYTYKLADKDNPDSVIKGWWVNTELLETKSFPIEQLLLGDTADNIIGCGERVPKIYKSGVKEGQSYQSREGFKPKQYETLFEECNGNVDELKIQTFLIYTKSFGFNQGLFEMQKNQRLLHLLSTDEDFTRENEEIPTFPIITSVIPNEVELEEIKPEF